MNDLTNGVDYKISEWMCSVAYNICITSWKLLFIWFKNVRFESGSAHGSVSCLHGQELHMMMDN